MKKLTAAALIVIIIAQIFISGCAVMSANSRKTLASAMVERQMDNEACLNMLKSIGLISERDYNNIVKEIESAFSPYTMESISDKDAKQLLNAVVGWYSPEWKSAEENFGYSKADWDELIITNSLANSAGSTINSSVSVIGEYNEPVPFQVVSDAVFTSLNSLLNYPMYSLNITSDNTDALDEVIAAVQSVKSNGATNMEVLNKYFSPCLDSEGKQITLLDSSLRENQIVVESEGISQGQCGQPYGTEPFAVNYANEPGKDLYINAPIPEIAPLIGVRMREFNKEAIQNIVNLYGSNSGTFLYVGNKIYIMSYPVDIVTSMETTETNFKCNLEPSNLYFSLYSGQLSFSDNSGEQNILNNTNSYYNLSPVKGAKDGNGMSLVSGDKYGVSKMEIRQGVYVEHSKIILRDYLEATYMPSVVSREDFVVFGRKIRFMRFEGARDDIVARIYNAKGEPLASSGITSMGMNLYINDFMDIQSVFNGELRSKRLGFAGEAVEKLVESTDTQQNNQNSSDQPQNDQLEDINSLDDLPEAVVSKIYPTEQFPGTHIGTQELSRNKQMFYSIAIRKDMFESALFSGWIYNTDDSKDSLIWWRNWLTYQQINYIINENSLTSVINKEYEFKLTQHGYVSFDLKVLAKLQQDINKDTTVQRNSAIRTIFLIAGTLMVMYGFLLPMAWAVDVNLNFGLNALQKLSLGHWVAVKTTGEQTFDGSLSPMTFGAVVGKSIVLVLVGIVFILVDIVAIVAAIVGAFGGVAKIIDEIFKGIR